MNFEEYLKISVQEINKELNNLLTEFINEAEKTNNKLLPFAKSLLDANMGGKRIRGVLAMIGYQLAGGSESRDIIKVASALEILHTALLIHDDIMDQSTTRRDMPSLYQLLGGDHYGISQAISLGDISFYLPIKIISNLSFPDKAKLRAISFLSETIINTGWGQILDMKKPQDNKDLEFIRIFKTAKYTVSGPMQIGAILAGADEKLINKIGEFGENLGIAFQIQDDILDGEAGELDQARAQALELTLKAKKIIPEITTDPKVKNLLEEMSEYLIERTV